jgi:drug/metabolite transporter (DMT)-like permease
LADCRARRLRGRHGGRAAVVQGGGDAGAAQGSLAERLLALAHNAYFLAALAAYLALSLVWVWLLRFTPLSRAYLFVALSFALVPLAAALAFGEPLSGRFLLGAVLTVCGLILVVS